MRITYHKEYQMPTERELTLEGDAFQRTDDDQPIAYYVLPTDSGKYIEIDVRFEDAPKINVYDTFPSGGILLEWEDYIPCKLSDAENAFSKAMTTLLRLSKTVKNHDTGWEGNIQNYPDAGGMEDVEM